MPKNPWDRDTLAKNLTKLAQIQVGERLTFNSVTGLFGILPSNSIGIASYDTKFQDDPIITVDFISSFFRSAYAYAYRNVEFKTETTQRHNQVGAAINGIWNFLDAYKLALVGVQDPTERQKQRRTKAQNIMVAINKVTNTKAPDQISGVDQGYLDLREQFKNHLIYALSQGQYLGVGDIGVCQSFCWEWFRRKMITGKKSFRESNWDQDPHEERSRMQRKVDKSIRGIQRAVEATAKKSEWFGDMSKHSPTFAGMFASHVTARGTFGANYPTSEWNNPESTDEGDGAKAFKSLLNSCRLHHAKASHPTGCYSISLQLLKGTGHHVAMHLGPASTHFFDPNVGEFLFKHPAEDHVFCDFGKAFWAMYRSGDANFYEWDIYHYYKE